ncbi:hypothetical protein [Spirosoma validum]|uniref:Uncharacterized protein n=1 Tax=Spirosoma validum TaxID=2771355 RepID=A0A927GBV9_9BACT|nr:hypothetical protein [Spirosoma validum]MBD2752019.1 hypothetical protein [Spirosoma validum]
MNTTTQLLLIIGLLSFIIAGLLVLIARLRRKQVRLLSGNTELRDLYRDAVSYHQQERAGNEKYIRQQHELLLSYQTLVKDQSLRIEELKADLTGAKQMHLN